MKTDKKSKEITVIPALIQMLDLRGAMVTIDAMVWASKHCDDGALSGRKGPPTLAYRYYISSRALTAGHAFRSHWGIESS